MNKPQHPLLDSLQKDIEFYKDAIKEVSNEIIEKKFSEYPIFVAHQYEVSLGELILDKSDLGTNWSINASVLEELQERGVVKEDKVAEFKRVYKDPKEFICIFLITEKGGNFIFIPYKSQAKPENN